MTHRLCLVFPSCSCFPPKIHLQSKGKTFQVVVAEYRSNLEGCKWLHCEALKGSEEEERKGARGLQRLMTLVHWWLEVSKRRDGEVWCSILSEVAQTFHCWMSGLCCEPSRLLLNQGSDSNGGKHTLLPRHPSGGDGSTLIRCTTLLIMMAGLFLCEAKSGIELSFTPRPECNTFYHMWTYWPRHKTWSGTPIYW